MKSIDLANIIINTLLKMGKSDQEEREDTYKQQ